MNPTIQTLILSLAGALIVTLAGMLWWFVRDRIRLKEKQEDMLIERWKLLEKRLGAGNDKFNRQDLAIEKLQTVFLEHTSKLLPVDTFNAYCEHHAEDHKDLEANISRMRDGQEEIKLMVAGMAERLNAGIDTMASMLSKVVTIPSDPKDSQ